MLSHIHAGACKQGEQHDEEHGAHCFSSFEEATQEMLRQIGRIAHDAEMGCDRDGCGCCSWCSVARALYRFFGQPLRQISEVELGMNGHSEWPLKTPREIVEVWAEVIDEKYETCALRSSAVV